MVIESFDHSYEATGVTMDIVVPPDYNNPEADMWDGISGYASESTLRMQPPCPCYNASFGLRQAALRSYAYARIPHLDEERLD